MGIFESFKKGIDGAREDVFSGKKESNLINFETINQQILDKSIDNTTVVLNIKKFMATSLNPNETN
jgi:hypothetical protein